MAREILFRGKREDNGEWLYGDLGQVNSDEGAYTIIFSENYKEFGFGLVDSATVGQYTGLIDKAGKRIFEGDIIRGPGNRMKTDVFVIRWSVPSCGFSAGEGKRVWPNLNQATVDGYEVVGNIHDNPELLEVCDETV